jgi:hypothetical protein
MRCEVRKIYFKTSPELNDGEHWSVIETDNTGIGVLIEQIKNWAEEYRSCKGCEIKIEIVEMEEDEVNSLPPM